VWLAEGPADLELAGEWSLGPPHLRVDAAARRITLVLPPGDPFAHLDLSLLAARKVRDSLLGRDELPDGRIYLGSSRWPFALPSEPPLVSRASAKALAGKHVMVVGCGSVGSEFVRALSDVVGRWTLVDGGTVSAFNPSRQWFGLSEVGQKKVDALARRLLGRSVRAVPRALGKAEADVLEKLLRESRPDLVVLATGTDSDAAIAPVLWRAGIPHLVAYGYPQARFFEITSVVPGEHTPCAHCFRGNLYKGVESQAPVSDEVASFLYSRPQQAERDRLYVNLVAEPATKIETVRIADVLARCAAQIAESPGQRSVWFAKMLEEGTTCLLGANVVERRENGTTAYGMTHAGQVIRLGLADVTGVEERLTCEECGRQMTVAHRIEQARCEDAETDRALLAAVSG
jgi:tRNA A37 threonylcarbamoyladenosine dehydratase